MKTLVIILAALLAIPSSALAVRKVEKKPKAQSSTSTQAGAQQSQQPAEKGVRSDQPAPEQQARPPQPAQEVKKPEKEDRFIDENGDGINDRIDQHQTVKIRKKESPQRESPKQEHQKRESSDKTEKPERRVR